MNPRDTSEERIRAAFRARFDATPEPPDTMFARTMAAISKEPNETAPRRAGWQSAARWWSALAAPARFATAAAIVVVGGTIAFGTVKATHERVIAADSAPATRITLDRDLAHGPRLARTGSMQLAVHDVASTARRIAALAARERGAIVTQDGARTRHAPHATIRIVLRVPAGSLDTTMQAVAMLGAVEARRIGTADLASRLDEMTDRLGRAQTAARTLRAAPSPLDDRHLAALEAEIARLSAQRGKLEQCIVTATLAIVLRSADAGRTAFRASGAQRHEPSQSGLRPTSILLARGSWFASHRSELARRRFRPFDLGASRALAGRSRSGGAATRRNNDPDRV